MNAYWPWVLGLLVLLVAFIVGESWRQHRALRKRGETRSERPSLIGTGMLELQSMLEPERKVEVIQAEMQQRDRQHPEHRAARPVDDGEGDD